MALGATLLGAEFDGPAELIRRCVSTYGSCLVDDCRAVCTSDLSLKGDCPNLLRR